MSTEPTTVLRPLAKLVAPHQHEVLLEALLGETSEADILRRAERVRFRAMGTVTPTDLVLQEAARVLPRAATFLRRSALEVQRRLGGCTIALVALAAQQALAIDDAQRQLEADEDHRRRQQATGLLADATVTTDVVEQAHASMQRARRRAAQRTIEIQRLLTKVDADVPQVATSRREPNPRAVAQALRHCADTATKLLRRDDEALLARAMLFGLDGATVQSWRHEAATLLDLVAEHEEAIRASRNAVARTPLDEEEVDAHETLHAMGTTVILLSHVVEAFEAGHRVDRRIPKLHSVVYTPAGKKRRRRSPSRSSST